jgi:antitoxin ParD1/3/4
MAKFAILFDKYWRLMVASFDKENLMATMNVSLPDAMKAWVERQAEGGLYGNASDYIRDLIRRDQQRKEAVAILQAAITEGLDSGTPVPFAAADFKLRMRERHVVR